MRANPARGIEVPEVAIERHGGDYSAGVIRGVAVVTRGEALGHGLWLDTYFLNQVAEAMNATAEGIKTRFTHPSLSGDGLGKFLGRMKSGYIDGDTVRGDLHFSPSAHETPDGDLAAYVMTLADTDPAAFGTSIVYTADYDAEDSHWTAHKAENGKFNSPDLDNIRNLPHARLAELWADDVVDEPAANPDGLFHRGQQLAQEADALLAYSLGLTDQAPELIELDIDPDRAGQFVRRFLVAHGLTITGANETMTDTTATVTDEAAEPVTPEVTDDVAAETVAPEGADEVTETSEAVDAEDAGAIDATEVEPVAAAQPALDAGRQECARFIEAFGPEGAEWFAAGLTFEEAQGRELELIREQRNELAKKLAAIDCGELEPVAFQVGTEEGTAQRAKTAETANQPEGLAALIAKNQAVLPSRN